MTLQEALPLIIPLAILDLVLIADGAAISYAGPAAGAPATPGAVVTAAAVVMRCRHVVLSSCGGVVSVLACNRFLNPNTALRDPPGRSAASLSLGRPQ